ncbi:MAG TPA: hypothetical protein VF984_06220 [Actinomycetota bacterium]
MRPSTRWIAALVGIAVVVALFVVLRPDGSSSGSSGSDVSPTGAASPATTGTGGPSPTGAPSATPTGGDVAELDVTVRNGDVQGPGEFDVTQGQEVRIVVDADVTDEVHVHGYDLHDDVSPGEPAEIEFTANAPGVFEVELESQGKLLFELKVSP